MSWWILYRLYAKCCEGCTITNANNVNYLDLPLSYNTNRLYSVYICRYIWCPLVCPAAAPLSLRSHVGNRYCELLTPSTDNSLFLSLQVKSCSAVTCATPLSPLKAAWRCTCASTLALSPLNAPSASFASEPPAIAKHTFNSTSGQTASEANPSVPPRPLVRPVRVRTQAWCRGWRPTRSSSQQRRKAFNLLVSCQQRTLTPTFTSRPTQCWQDSLTRVCCSQVWWDRPSCLPPCQVRQPGRKRLVII